MSKEEAFTKSLASNAHYQAALAEAKTDEEKARVGATARTSARGSCRATATRARPRHDRSGRRTSRRGRGAVEKEQHEAAVAAEIRDWEARRHDRGADEAGPRKGDGSREVRRGHVGRPECPTSFTRSVRTIRRRPTRYTVCDSAGTARSRSSSIPRRRCRTARGRDAMSTPARSFRRRSCRARPSGHHLLGLLTLGRWNVDRPPHRERRERS